MKRETLNIFFSFLYPVTDFFAINFAILLSYKVYRLLDIGQQVYYEKLHIIPISLAASLVSVIVLLIFGAYKKESSLLNAEEIKNVVMGISFSYLLFAVVMVFMTLAPSRYVLVFSYFASVMFVVIERTIFYHLPLANIVKGLNKKILIYGAGELGQALFRSIVNSPKLGIVPVGFVDDNLGKHNKSYRSSGFSHSNYSLPVLGTGNDVGKLIQKLDIDEIYVAISNIDNRKFAELKKRLDVDKVKVSFVPNLYSAFIHKVKIRQIGQIPLVREEDRVATYPYKRHVDLFLAVTLMCLLLPVFLIIALAIKMDSKGPVFFRQDRVGKGGTIFQIYKFRSMFSDADPYVVNPLSADDSRITRVGRYLRKTSLDELPQIINVLKGDMAFVGPRPEMPFIVAEYNEIHKERLKVLPGITGLWQLSGDRKRAIHENMDYDLYYVRNCSFFLDVAILVETVIFALRGV
ncbi:MAG: sugar transferase [Thermodesulfobacteriota bacterium]|nr:sugar transferase [Thermodesulfobacteriota bacterium]